MRYATRYSALLAGLALALTSMGQVPMAQAQTAHRSETQASTQIAVESFEAPGTSLRTHYPEMVRMSGKVLNIAADTDLLSERFVLYAPLNQLWLIDETGSVVEHAYIEVKQTPFDHLMLHWRHWFDVDMADVLPAAAQMPAFTVETDTPHPLATAYDALLAKPLAQAFDPLPAGAYFNAGGHVFDANGIQIAEWDSFGPEIALRLTPVEDIITTPTAETETAIKASHATLDQNPITDLRWQWFAVADLAAALTPDGSSEQEEN